MFADRQALPLRVVGAGILSVGLACASLFAPASARALPWDVDMYRQPSLKANEVARAPVPGTVPVGHVPFRMTADEADGKLTNPVQFDQDSVWRGQRIYSANCATCHGQKGDGKGPVGQWLGVVPNLLDDFYKNRTDGRAFAVIHNGGAVMPRYGFKLSVREHWDVVNYLRFLQGREVAEVKRP